MHCMNSSKSYDEDGDFDINFPYINRKKKHLPNSQVLISLDRKIV